MAVGAEPALPEGVRDALTVRGSPLRVVPMKRWQRCCKKLLDHALHPLVGTLKK